jgi:GNAT superfamily N-acetyltransferase
MKIDPEYARNYQKELVLQSGVLLKIRSIRPDDKEALAGLFRQLSKESIYLRFIAKKKGLSNSELGYLTELDFVNHVALVAVFPEVDEKRIVGVARYIIINEEETKPIAEIGLLVVDEFHGKGIGKALLADIANLARKSGIFELEACVLQGNLRVRELFQHCGYRVGDITQSCG